MELSFLRFNKFPPPPPPSPPCQVLNIVSFGGGGVEKFTEREGTKFNLGLREGERGDLLKGRKIKLGLVSRCFSIPPPPPSFSSPNYIFLPFNKFSLLPPSQVLYLVSSLSIIPPPPLTPLPSPKPSLVPSRSVNSPPPPPKETKFRIWEESEGGGGKFIEMEEAKVKIWNLIPPPPPHPPP